MLIPPARVLYWVCEKNNRTELGEEAGGGGGVSIHRKFGRKEILFSAVTFVTPVLWAPPGLCLCVDTIRARERVEKERQKLYKKESQR